MSQRLDHCAVHNTYGICFPHEPDLIEVHARTYELEDNEGSLTITLTDEGIVVDHIQGDEVVGTYYRFIDEMIPT